MCHVLRSSARRAPFVEALSKAAWQVALCLGVATVLLGICALVWPGKSVVVVAVLFGIYLLVSGILQFAEAFSHRFSGGTRVLMFASATLSVMLGLICFRGAEQSVVLLGLWIGIGWLFRGFTELSAAMTMGNLPGRGWMIFFGIVGVCAGMVLIVSPVHSIVLLAVLAGIWLLALGMFEIVTAFQLKRAADG
ncbi:HdeD family acid-resistance protein [Streptacidiphilus sp. 4-A2]|nr:HdeD family acid-resistance protein [Streptacidiphilus sp. 4-A2]